jgi:predicted nuclease of predicted toxin-antitoxin system
MPVPVKLDEDLAPLVATPLEAAGHSVATVHGQGWGGMKDPVLWPKVCDEGRYFITADKGFGDIRAYPPGTHPGIMLLRAEHESIVAYRALVEYVLMRYDLASLRGALTVVSPRGIRVRRSPP